ncbi:hypothetical protein [Runella slithyformis]|uniref:Uncharacterized protein n=1 Tax=Runella slithyformis (strain ATCC 29530 / DSM 19594 / LMG 11500 / NCIMB 11436 / LSU 4) TaxID=761193 RepID=A0A7U4E4H6_RUNSL|nr:hypothetical protein [Runella slithyformis]AEI47084.1 hypothetical protein Runsl_0641 [Runella slithyformis DSM 19594]
MNKELSLSEVIEFFKKNQISSFEDEIDEYGHYFITAARLAAVVLAPSPLTALSNFCSGIDAMSLRVSKLFSWLPDKCKYGNKGREKLAKNRYELSSIVYVKLLNIAILDAFKEELQPLLKKILSDVNLNDLDKEDFKRKAKEAESAQLKISIDTYNSIDSQKIKEIIDKIVDPILPVLLIDELSCKESYFLLFKE